MKKKIIFTFFIGLMMILIYWNNEPSDKLSIGILQIVEHPALNTTRLGIQDELNAAGFTKDKINWQYRCGQGESAIMLQQAKDLFHRKPKVLIGIATVPSQILVRQSQGEIPVVFTSVTDPLSAGLMETSDKAKKSVTGMSNWLDLQPQILLIQKIQPGLKKLGVIYNPGEANSVEMIRQLNAILPTLGVTLVTAQAQKTIEVPQATLALASKVNAIFISNDNIALAAFPALTRTALKNKCPVYVSDLDLVNEGALAAVGPDQYQLGRDTGKMVVEILNGKKPEEIAVGYPDRVKLILNQNTAAQLEWHFSEEILSRADAVIKAQGENNA